VLQSTGALDHLALHEQVRLTGGTCPRCRLRLRSCNCGGTCARCRGGAGRLEALGFEATRLPLPLSCAVPLAPAPRQTLAPAPPPFDAWEGWSPPVTLACLNDARKQPSAVAHPRLQPFFMPGPNVYRITLLPRRYFSIGMIVSQRQTIAHRVGQHYNASTKLRRPQATNRRRSRGTDLHEKMVSADPSQILVQAGRLSRAMPARVVHMYEIWLQHREGVSDWHLIRDTWTFESAFDPASEAFAELEALG
jgi:hypothetical protein